MICDFCNAPILSGGSERNRLLLTTAPWRVRATPTGQRVMLAET